jgi:hypothetical protein
MIAGWGFTRWAWEEAQRRTGHVAARGSPVERHEIGYTHGVFPVSSTYYGIIDHAEAAWFATAPERSAGICPRVKA